MLLVASVPRLTLPIVAPPLPDVDGIYCKCKSARLVVVRPLAHDREVCWAVEHNQGEPRQVDLVDLMEDLLTLARIRCRQFMCVEVMPRWSPDGKWLIYFREPNDSGQPSIMAVFVINVDGKGARQLTTPEMAAGEPDWSPDGMWIVFATHPLHYFSCCQQSNLYRMHLDGSGMEQLTRLEGDGLRATQPRYTPDGKWIVFTAVTPSNRSLWAIPAAGGKPVVIATGGFYTHGTREPNS